MREAELAAAADAKAIASYRERRTHHPLLPFADWSACGAGARPPRRGVRRRLPRPRRRARARARPDARRRRGRADGGGPRRRHAPHRLPALAAVLPAAGARVTFRCAELSLELDEPLAGTARRSRRAGSSSSSRSRGDASTGSSPRARRCCSYRHVRGTVPRTWSRDSAGTSCARTARATRAARSAARPSRRRSSACCRARSTSARTSAGTASPRTCSCCPDGLCFGRLDARTAPSRSPPSSRRAACRSTTSAAARALEPEQQAAEILVRRELGLTRPRRPAPRRGRRRSSSPTAGARPRGSTAHDARAAARVVPRRQGRGGDALGARGPSPRLGTSCGPARSRAAPSRRPRARSCPSRARSRGRRCRAP